MHGWDDGLQFVHLADKKPLPDDDGWVVCMPCVVISSARRATCNAKDLLKRKRKMARGNKSGSAA
jgi:hypothetical protein